MADLYHERFLDHYRKPRNRGELESADISHRVENQLCGDWVKLDIRLGGAGCVSQVGFSGDGCVVCIASASILTEELLGKTEEELRALGDEQMLGLLHVSLGTARSKCALLPLRALQAGLADWERSS